MKIDAKEVIKLHPNSQTPIRYAIELEGIRKDYQIGLEHVHALRGVDLKVKKGEYIAIMGPSGSGKSTLLHILGCLDKPTRGQYFLDGTDVASMSEDQLASIRSERIGFVFQAFNLIPGMTALENIMIPLQINGVDKKGSKHKAKSLLALVGLSERENHRANELSGGEKQRVALARAMANDPAFILADEPTGNLDSKTSEEVMKYIHRLWEDLGVTVVVVTHEPVVARYSQRIIRLKDGMVEAEISHKAFHNHFDKHVIKMK